MTGSTTRMELSLAEVRLIIKERRALETEFQRGIQTVMASISVRKEAVIAGNIPVADFIQNLEELYGQ